MTIKYHQGHQKPGVSGSGEAQYNSNLVKIWILPGVKWSPNPAKQSNLRTKACKNVYMPLFESAVKCPLNMGQKTIHRVEERCVIYKLSRAKFPDPLFLTFATVERLN